MNKLFYNFFKYEYKTNVWKVFCKLMKNIGLCVGFLGFIGFSCIASSLNDYAEKDTYLTNKKNEKLKSKEETEPLTWQNAEERELESSDLNRKLYIAVITRNLKLAEEFIKQGANVNTTHGIGKYSLLQIAIDQGNLDVVELLLKHNADPNYINSEGDTALHLIVEARTEDVVTFAKPILAAFANPKIKNKKGQTALDILKARNPKCVEAFQDLILRDFAAIENSVYSCSVDEASYK